MADLTTASANITINNTDKKRVCSVNNVSPTITANNAEAFVTAVETLYNNGTCKAQVRIVYDLVP